MQENQMLKESEKSLANLMYFFVRLFFTVFMWNFNKNLFFFLCFCLFNNLLWALCCVAGGSNFWLVLVIIKKKIFFWKNLTYVSKQYLELLISLKLLLLSKQFMCLERIFFILSRERYCFGFILFSFG